MVFGGFEWVLIIVAFLLLFGAKRIPNMVRGIGQGIKEFRKARNEVKTELDQGHQEPDEAQKV